MARRKADLTPEQLAAKREAKKARDNANSRVYYERHKAAQAESNRLYYAAWKARNSIGSATYTYAPGRWNAVPLDPDGGKRCPICHEEPIPLPVCWTVHACRCQGRLWRHLGKCWSMLYLDELWDARDAKQTPPENPGTEPETEPQGDLR